VRQVPIACGGVTAIPGNIIMAGDDGPFEIWPISCNYQAK